MSRRKWVPAQTKVVKQGDESDFVCFCMQGQLRVLLETELVEEDKTVNILDDGACFGDWGVVNQLRRSASLATITNAELLIINGHSFKTSLDPAVLQALTSQATKVTN